MLNKNNLDIVNRFFNNNEHLTNLFSEICGEAFEDNDSFWLRVGKELKAGLEENEPFLSVYRVGSDYFIFLKKSDYVNHFRTDKEAEIIDVIKRYNKTLSEEKALQKKLQNENKQKEALFIDSEIDIITEKILDLAAIVNSDHYYHGTSVSDFRAFAKGYHVIVGHNIVVHDLKYLSDYLESDIIPIDTLFLSALLFPKKPYHKLIKDDKIVSFEKNNPLSDAKKAMMLFSDEVNAFKQMDEAMKELYYLLLSEKEGFAGFFNYIGYSAEGNIAEKIRLVFDGNICSNSDIETMCEEQSVELAYALALIATNDESSVVPPWILRRYPETANVIRRLRSIPCRVCNYCKQQFSTQDKLKQFFDYDSFRLFDGEPLQENAVDAAIRGDSLIAVFPTGGGKSLTFQLPALIAHETEHALTVVISPLQALMKDQVDNLRKHNIVAVTINGLLDPISRKDAIEQVENGTASILYIAPESLRNNTIRWLLKRRTIARFVIDEAHCFSSWGQDFRIDYLYIGKFIRELQKEKRLSYNIPVSCFTATAGKWVIKDIQDYFDLELGLTMQTFIASSERKNLQYRIVESRQKDKYSELRNLIMAHKCPTIIYVFSVKKTHDLAKRLCDDGFRARAFNGEMNSVDKQEAQESFINNEVDVMVATSAFGMGVDKDDVGLVIHYQVPSSLENYMQESGRAGRRTGSIGKCVALYDERDIEFLFYFLNQTKLTIGEIKSVWRAIKQLSKGRKVICKSSIEIAKEAGWNDNTERDTNIFIRTAIGALERAGYVERLNNDTQIFATGIIPNNMDESSRLIDQIDDLDETHKNLAKRILTILIGTRSRAKAGNEDSSKNTDYLAEILGVEHSKVLEIIDILKANKILADSNDLKAYIYAGDKESTSLSRLNRYLRLEHFLIEDYLTWEEDTLNYKDLNDSAQSLGFRRILSKEANNLLVYWATKGYINYKKMNSTTVSSLSFNKARDEMHKLLIKKEDVCRFIIEYLFNKESLLKNSAPLETNRRYVEFSLLELQTEYQQQMTLHEGNLKVSIKELQDALIYIQRIDAMDIEGGFFVLYQTFKIKRLEMNNLKQYTQEDYRILKAHYSQKIRQIHMMDEYSKLMLQDAATARQFAIDYFEMDNDAFDNKYFSRERIKALKNNISPKKYDALFGSLSPIQKSIINDDSSQFIMVAAGPGSGKTMVLVHKLASLILLEDVKCEQLLMLTFSRLAATEFKERLIKLIGNAAYGVEIKTFHSYCFDILTRKGDTAEFNSIVPEAVQMIRDGEVELERITKAVLVIDEAQDMDANEYELIKTLIELNEDMRVIMVGDDDQNIFEFRGSSSVHMKHFSYDYEATCYEMVDNYRSDKNVVTFANEYVNNLNNRLKQEPIRSISSDAGSVSLTTYTSSTLCIPVVEKIIANHSFINTCVLTWTNDEAYEIAGALSEKGINAKLIQSQDNIILNNIAEIRYFSGIIKKECDTPTISSDLWAQARDLMRGEYRDSNILDTCLEIIDRFEVTNRPLYMSDFEEYLMESKFEDFLEGKDNEIVVSTIHKSKGREYDTVYLVLSNCQFETEENTRVVYVGATRAKKNLHILCNTNAMDNLKNFCSSVEKNEKIYEKPRKILFNLSYKDIWLDYSMNYQEEINLLRCGEELRFDNGLFYANMYPNEIPVARLSRLGKDKLRGMLDNRSVAIKSNVGIVVHWFKKDAQQEYLLPLPTLYLEDVK